MNEHYPGVETDTLATQPAEQVTLLHLLTDINNKLYGDDDNGLGYGARKDLSLPGSPDRAASIHVMGPNEDRQFRHPFAQVHQFVDTDENTRLVVTQYSVFDTSDGWHIEKVTGTTSSNDEGAEVSASEDTLQLEFGPTAAADTQKSFVSEKETRKLLAFLQALEPSRR